MNYWLKKTYPITRTSLIRCAYLFPCYISCNVKIIRICTILNCIYSTRYKHSKHFYVTSNQLSAVLDIRHQKQNLVRVILGTYDSITPHISIWWFVPSSTAFSSVFCLNSLLWLGLGLTISFLNCCDSLMAGLFLSYSFSTL